MKRTIVVACLAILSSFARADYPDRPIRLVVPFAAGGGVDVLARAIGQRDVQHIPYKGTPRPILDKLNAEIDRALADPDVKRRLEDMGVVIQPGSPEQLGAFIRGETDKWSAVIRKVNIKPE